MEGLDCCQINLLHLCSDHVACLFKTIKWILGFWRIEFIFLTQTLRAAPLLHAPSPFPNRFPLPLVHVLIILCSQSEILFPSRAHSDATSIWATSKCAHWVPLSQFLWWKVISSFPHILFIPQQQQLQFFGYSCTHLISFGWLDFEVRTCEWATR